MKKRSFVVLAAILALSFSGFAQDTAEIPENVYKGELVAFPGAWNFQIGRDHVILVSDEELDGLTDPDKVLNLTLTFDPVHLSLRQICERAKASGCRTLIIAFDHFFSQYRPGQDKPRTLTPDMDEYVQRIAKIGAFAQQYGLGLELSLLTPLEIGPAYRKATGESGVWMQYREGLRDPKSGAYNVEFWRQTKWGNNKGIIQPEEAGFRVFAFKESVVHGTPYRVVDPNSIVDISGTVKVEVYPGLDTKASCRVRAYGEGGEGADGLDRVLVVQQYKTPEMDYFSPNAAPFLQSLVDRYVDAGVKLNALYSDEMHIQQDWNYFGHHDLGEFTLRYVSPGLAARYAERFGEQYRDFAKYLVYFCYAQEDFLPNLEAKTRSMHVFGASPEAIRQTALFRARYYHLLQDGVVDLFAGAKHYAERRTGYRLEARAHATWAESPTIDHWNVERQPQQPNQYEYTPNFVWSCTVHQAAAACHDYFKWGDFLTGNGNDHPEGGWLDRNYFAMALACSTGILNDVPYSYCAHWGMPGGISERRMALVNTCGTASAPPFGLVQDMQHRDVEVLMLYPLDLVAVEERFGSWMTQYGYANYVTQAKLLERGKVVNGAIEMAGRRFTTLATLFEPFPSNALRDMMKQMSEQGGRVIWSSAPPQINLDGQPVLEAWQSLFGAKYDPDVTEGRLAPGREIKFSGVFDGVPPQTILTDFLVDRTYPVAPLEGTSPIATMQGLTVGTHRALPSGGSATFLGFRPRDDQAASLGYETRTWFEVLSRLGAYPATGKFPDANDNTEYVSRTSPWLACRFPNGATAVSPHFRDLEENWPGGFARKKEQDEEIMNRLNLPPFTLSLKEAKINGHTIGYEGIGAMCFRVDSNGELIAFAGGSTKAVAIDGKVTEFADAPLPLVAWAPIPESRRVPGGAVWQAMVHGAGALRIPAAGLPRNMKVFAQGATPGSKGAEVPVSFEGENLLLKLEPGFSGAWLYGVPTNP